MTSAPERFRKGFMLFLVIAITILFLFMVRDFIIALLLGGIFCGLLYPLYDRLLEIPRLGRHPGWTSALLLTLSVFAIGIPLIGLLSVVTSEAMQISENVVPWIQQQLLPQMSLTRRFPDWLPFGTLLNPYKESIINTMGEAASSMGTYLVMSGSALTQGTASFLLKTFVMLYAMFFFFLRGPLWLQEMASYLPLTPEDREAVISRGLAVTRASMKGILGIGLLQGVLTGVAFAIIGLQGAAFWGVMVIVLSAVPGIGPPLVWLPAVMYLFLTGQTGWAIGLALWGALVIGTVDNILRPRIVSAEAKIPDLLVLISTLGGIMMFGAVGIIMGPIVAAALVTIMDLYQITFVRQLPIPEIEPTDETEPVPLTKT